MVPGRIGESGSSRREHVFCLVPRRDFSVDDTWFVAGMRGTGTKDVRLQRAFVPAHRALTGATYAGANPPGATVNTSSVYRAELLPLRGSNIMGPLFGAAEGAYVDYVDQTKVRVGALFGDRPAENLAVQLRLSESAAELHAPCLVIEDDSRTMRERMRNDTAIVAEERAVRLRDRSFAAKLCLAAVERVVQQMGQREFSRPIRSSAIFATSARWRRRSASTRMSTCRRSPAWRSVCRARMRRSHELSPAIRWATRMTRVARSPVLSRAELVGRASELVPVLRARAKATEELRRLPDETMRDLYAAGFLRICQPARYGGYETDWGVHLDVAREFAKGCASAARIVSVVGMHAVIVGRMAKRCQDLVWGEQVDQLIETGSAKTTGRIVRTPNGYRVSGTWRFASGLDHATWVIVTAPIEAEDGSLLPNARVLLAKNEAEVVDTWFVSGMCGTGSKDVNVPDIVLPEWRVEDVPRNFGTSPPGAAVNPDAYIYTVEFFPYFGVSIFAPIVGAAEGALADYVAITRERKGAIFGTDVRMLTPVQHRLAESAAEIKVAGMLLDWSLALLHRRGVAREPLPQSELAEIGRDRAYIAKLCVAAVTRLVRQMGALGLSDDNPVQRHYRNVTAMATQVGANWDVHAGQYSRLLLGLPLSYRPGSAVPQRH
ncbi:MAG: hypothetical protein EXQ85_09000 [Alphaproteobacteria bacterium]|nr:hypothetical protein [Alphaproteobacteria bacterium]